MHSPAYKSGKNTMKGKNNSNKVIYQSNHLFIYFDLSTLFVMSMLSVKVNNYTTGFVKSNKQLAPISMTSGDDRTNIFH